MIRKLIPKEVKLFLQLKQKEISDFVRKTRFAKISTKELKYQITKSQIIKKNEGYQAKIHNLKTAAHYIEPILIQPNEIFSFWKIIGAPTQKRGYKKGRTILNDILTKSIGGGLCQISGLIYHICLDANLDITERHNHSLDLYNDTTRYTPLGSDATVVFGYRDLRFRNNLETPIRFKFDISETEITVYLCSEKEITQKDVRFHSYEIDATHLGVTTFVDGIEKAHSRYKKNKTD